MKQQAALDRIADALETLAKPSSPQALINEHGSMTTKFGELCRIMMTMSANLTKVLDQETPLNPIERAQFLRTLAVDLKGYGENNLKVFKMHMDSHDEVTTAIRDAMKDHQ